MEWDQVVYQNSTSFLKMRTEWSIKKLLENEKLFGVAKTPWMNYRNNKSYISLASSEYWLKDEVKWFESTLLKLIDRHTKILYITPFSQRWWNDKVANRRKVWVRVNKTYRRDLRYTDKLK